MKKALLTTVTFLFIKLLSGQLPSNVQIAWQYNIKDTLTGPFITSDNFNMLSDSSVIFLTKEFNQAPAANTKPAAIYLSKIDALGNLAINRKKMLVFSPQFYLQNIDVTSDGGVVALFLKDRTDVSALKTDSAYIVKYDKDLNTVGQRFISNQQTSGGLWRVTGVTALTDGKVIVGYNNREEPTGPRELVSTRAVFTCFNNNGDSLYTVASNDPIVGIEKGSDAAFFITYRQLFENALVLHSSVDGSLLQLVYFLIPRSGLKPEVLVSNFALIPATQKFAAVTFVDYGPYSFDGPNNFVLYVTDNILSHPVAKYYDSVTLFKRAYMQLVNDKGNGMYVMQSVSAASSPISVSAYFVLCHLNSEGNTDWSVNFDNPGAAIGGLVGKLMPLSGNDFIVVVNTASGPALIRLTANTQSPASASFTTTSIKNATDALASPDVKATDFSVKVASNPTSNYFSIIAKSNSNSPVAVIVTDNQGKLVERIPNVSPNSTFQVGQQYKPGFYIISVVQNGKSQTIKLVKQ